MKHSMEPYELKGVILPVVFAVHRVAHYCVTATWSKTLEIMAFKFAELMVTILCPSPLSCGFIDRWPVIKEEFLFRMVGLLIY